MQLALVHDWLNQIGGAEAVLETLVQMFPQSPVYTSMYWRDAMPERYQHWDIHPLWLNRAPGIYQHHQQYLPLYPVAWSGLNLSQYDVILSNKSGFCHGVQKKRRSRSALHICYCLAPTRYVWTFDEYTQRERVSARTRSLLKPIVSVLRRWDYAAAQRVDHFIAISSEIQARIKTYYQRDSIVIHPPVDLQRYQPQTKPGDYFLIVSRLIPYKRIDLAIEAFNRLGLPLVIAGDGRDRARLESLAKPNVQFLGRVPEADLPDLFAQCRAFVFPGYEDFGLAPVEAQACGRPVIAFGAGGALDTVIDGQTGVLFTEQTIDDMIAAIKRLSAIKFDPQVARSNAERFSDTAFKEKLGKFVVEKYIEHSTRAAQERYNV
jgi:glycosyltransferase involved in cell wall biosynthesis